MVLAIPVEGEEMHAQIRWDAVKVEFAVAVVELFHLIFVMLIDFLFLPGVRTYFVSLLLPRGLALPSHLAFAAALHQPVAARGRYLQTRRLSGHGNWIRRSLRRRCDLHADLAMAEPPWQHLQRCLHRRHFR